MLEFIRRLFGLDGHGDAIVEVSVRRMFMSRSRPGLVSIQQGRSIRPMREASKRARSLASTLFDRGTSEMPDYDWRPMSAGEIAAYCEAEQAQRGGVSASDMSLSEMKEAIDAALRGDDLEKKVVH